MRLFKKSPISSLGEADVQAAQETVQAITAALKSGADQQDIAAKLLSVLTKAMAKMDDSVRHSARLEKDIARQAAELRTAKGDLEKKRAWAQEQTTKLASVQQNRDTLRREIESAKIKLGLYEEQEVTVRESDVR